MHMNTFFQTPFFSSTLFIQLYPFMYFVFAFQGLQNLVPWVSPLHYVMVCKSHIYMPKMAISSLLIQISFFYAKFASFQFIIYFVPNLTSTWLKSYGLVLQQLALTHFVNEKVCSRQKQQQQLDLRARKTNPTFHQTLLDHVDESLIQHFI